MRYVGKTIDLPYRFKQHLLTSSKLRTHLGNWIRKCLRSGAPPSLIVLSEVPDAESGRKEIWWIARLKKTGASLVNATDGGEGMRPTPETRKKMGRWIRSSVAGEKNPMFGRKHTAASKEAIGFGNSGPKHGPTTRRKMSRSKIGKNNPMFGKRHSAAARAKMRAAR